MNGKKVEELRMTVLENLMRGYGIDEHVAAKRFGIDPLIAAAHEEGFAACKEEGIEGLQATFKETLAKAHAEGVKEQKERDDLCLMYEREGNEHEQKARVDFAHAEGVVEGFSECKAEGIEGLQVTFKETLAKAHASGVAEGEEQMRALIKSKVVNVGFHLDRDPGPIVYVPCWILDNTSEPTGPVKRGEFKVCLDEDDYPAVLAPTKESEK